jgi:hypothetical protein
MDKYILEVLMPDNRTRVDVTPPGSMTPQDLASYASKLVGRSHVEGGKVIGEIREVSVEDGRLIAEVKLNTGVILG